jgi:P-type E1-E2 ATPase
MARGSVPESLSTGDAAPAGTFVVGGEGLGVATATGAHTRLAGISLLTQTARRPASPLDRELNRVVRAVAAMAIGVGGAFWLLALLTGESRSDAFLFAIGVTVALVPEGLLPTVTLSLAMGAQRMAGRKAVVRHLDAVETLGATSFICTDKTGTLTRNEMNVLVAWTPRGDRRSGEGYTPRRHRWTGGARRAASRGVAAVAASDGRS